jgi:hypothetical protein
MCTSIRDRDFAHLLRCQDVGHALSERNTMHNEAVVVGLALKVLAEVWMSDGDERLGALRD